MSTEISDENAEILDMENPTAGTVRETEREIKQWRKNSGITRNKRHINVKITAVFKHYYVTVSRRKEEGTVLPSGLRRIPSSAHCAPDFEPPTLPGKRLSEPCAKWFSGSAGETGALRWRTTFALWRAKALRQVPHRAYSSISREAVASQSSSRAEGALQKGIRPSPSYKHVLRTATQIKGRQPRSGAIALLVSGLANQQALANANGKTTYA